MSSRTSWPSSQAIRYCRPLMVTLMWLIRSLPHPSTARIVPIAASSRSPISRLARSSRRDFTSEPSSSSASRERSAPSAWIRVASSSSSRSASRRRSTALSSASSAAISRRVAASISTEAGSAWAGTVDGSIAHDVAHDRRGAPSWEPAAGQNRRLGKRLDREIYVASEASATPHRNYAPQSNFARQLFRAAGRFTALDFGK